jgi:hypothetical protein
MGRYHDISLNHPCELGHFDESFANRCHVDWSARNLLFGVLDQLDLQENDRNTQHIFVDVPGNLKQQKDALHLIR